jgi:hypothetical protein
MTIMKYIFYIYYIQQNSFLKIENEFKGVSEFFYTYRMPEHSAYTRKQKISVVSHDKKIEQQKGPCDFLLKRKCELMRHYAD